MTARLRASFSDEETAKPRDFVIGQNADGRSEVAGQRPIKTQDDETSVSFWNSGKHVLKSEQELKPHTAPDPRSNMQIQLGPADDKEYIFKLNVYLGASVLWMSMKGSPLPDASSRAMKEWECVTLSI